MFRQLPLQSLERGKRSLLWRIRLHVFVSSAVLRDDKVARLAHIEKNSYRYPASPWGVTVK